MTYLRLIAIFSLIGLVTGCTPVKVNDNNLYKFYTWGTTTTKHQASRYSLLVSQPDAVGGYQTEQMLYMNKPYKISPFVNHAWLSTPANMLYPLLIESLQSSHAFFAVTSSAYSDKTDYRLDTQLLQFQQNFLVKPSVIEMDVKVVLTRVEDNRTLMSRIFSERIPCPADTPVGGVVAANQATKALTTRITQFVINQIQQTA